MPHVDAPRSRMLPRVEPITSSVPDAGTSAGTSARNDGADGGPLVRPA
jgi:hypothetical protein